MEDYYIPGGKLGPEDDIVPEEGPVRRIIIFPEDDIVPEEGPVRRIIIFPEDDIVPEEGPVRRNSIFPGEGPSSGSGHMSCD